MVVFVGAAKNETGGPNKLSPQFWLTFGKDKPKEALAEQGTGVGRGETFIIASSLTQIAVCMNTSTLKKLNKL